MAEETKEKCNFTSGLSKARWMPRCMQYMGGNFSYHPAARKWIEQTNREDVMPVIGRIQEQKNKLNNLKLINKGGRSKIKPDL